MQLEKSNSGSVAHGRNLILLV